MFKSKREVDTHVKDLLAKSKDEEERIRKCLKVAKIYASIKEFEAAKRHLETFLWRNPESGEGLRLLGDICLELKEEEKALEAYQSAFEKVGGRDTLNRVCDLLTKRGEGLTLSEEDQQKWFRIQREEMDKNGTPSTPSFNNGNTFLNGLASRRVLGSGDRGPGGTQQGQNGGLNITPRVLNFQPTLNRNGPSPHVSSTPKQRGGFGMGTACVQASPERVMMQMSFMEKRVDELVEKLVDSNVKLLCGINSMRDTLSSELKGLRADVLMEVKGLREDLSKEFRSIGQNFVETKSELHRLSEKGSEFTKKLEGMVELTNESLSKVQSTLQQSQVQAQTQKPKPASKTNTKTPVVDNRPLSEVFRKPEGSWDCTSCYVNNKEGIVKCVACGTTKPGAPSSTPDFASTNTAKTPASQPAPAFTFGFKNTPPASTTPSVAPPAFLTTTKTAISTAVATTTASAVTSASYIFSNLNLFTTSPATGVLSFADLAKPSSAPGAFMKPVDFKGFGGEGAPLFSATQPAAKESTDRPRRESGGSEGGDDFVPTAEFAPVIPLPPLVEAVLGDENENVLFEHRAKLYRFDSSTKEWKERGVGNIKILQDKDNANQVRIVMWREKVGKPACNHRITGDMKIEFYQGNQKTVKWTAVDHAEGDPRPEIFTCRFGQEEKGIEFKKKVEEMAAFVGENPDSNKPSPRPKQDAPTQKVDLRPFSEIFKKPEGSWDCSSCYVVNKSEVVKCVACGTMKDGAPSTSLDFAPTTTASSLPQTAFTFGFKTTPPSAPASTTMPAASIVTSTSSIFSNLNLFNTTAGTGALSFSDLVKPSTATETFKKPLDFQGFGGEGAPVFSATPPAGRDKPDRPRRESEGSEGGDDFVPTAEFAPVIPLPPLVEAVLGDENENVLFEHRAKLYRFDSSLKEWKERGVGNIKILQDKDNANQVRIVMWREKVGKPACNHRITGDMKIEFYQGNQKTVKWTAVDHAEGDPRPEIFTCRFGQEEKGIEFKKKVEEMAAFVGENPDSNKPSPKPDAKKSAPISEVDNRPLSEVFKKPEGSWDCTSCYVNNKAVVVKCVACGTTKPGAPSNVEETAPSQQQPAFTFGFTNTLPASTTHSASFTSTATSTSSVFSNLNLFNTSGATGGLSFADLATPNTASGAFMKPVDFKGFGGEGAPLFSFATPAGKDRTDRPRRESGGSEGGDDFVPTAEFAPVIPLPPLVEAVLGDENENPLFEQRAKLYRFDSSTKEWKERGVGNIKILQDKDNANQVRIVMWREKVGKPACNHRITGDMKMEFYQGNQKTVKWTAVDHAEGDPRPEIFTCRFGQEEKGVEFKKKVEEMAAFVGENPDSNKPSPKPKQDAPPANQNADLRPFSEIFKKPEGSWDCSSCYVLNKAEVVKCVACGTMKDGAPSSSSDFAPTTTAQSLLGCPRPWQQFDTRKFGH